MNTIGFKKRKNTKKMLRQEQKRKTRLGTSNKEH